MTSSRAFFMAALRKAGFVGILDAVPDIRFLYSLTRLHSGQTLALRVVNDSGADLDIGFMANGSIDASAISAHCGGGAVRVRRWYGINGQHLSQPDNALMPNYIGGAIPYIRIEGDKALSLSNPANPINSTEVVLAFKWLAVASQNSIPFSLRVTNPFGIARISVSAPWSDGGGYWDAGNPFVNRVSAPIPAPYGAAHTHICTHHVSQNYQRIQVDGNTLVSGAAGTASLAQDGILIGSPLANGHVYSLLVGGTALSAADTLKINNALA